MTRRRAWRQRTTASLAVTLLTMGAITSMSAAQETEAPETEDRPPLWESQSAASAIHLALNTSPPLLPFEELIRLDVPDGDSSWSHTGTSRARASEVWPGVVGAQGAGLLCEFQEGMCPEGFPPDYPFTATAVHPHQPEAQTGTGGAVAYAGRDHVATRAAASQLIPVLEALGVVADVGSIEAVTRQEFVDDGQELVSSAFARLQDVDLVGGIVNIDALEVRSVSRSRGADEVVNDSAVNIAGLTIDGQEVALGSRGLTLTDEGGGDEQVAEINERFAEALEDTGYEMRLLGVQESLEGGIAISQVSGLIISFEQELSDEIGVTDLLPFRVGDLPLPDEIPIPEPETFFTTYVGSVVIGNAGSRAFVSQEGFTFDGFEDLGGDLGGTDTTVDSGEFEAPTDVSPVDSGDFGGTPDIADAPEVADGLEADDTAAESPQAASPGDQSGQQTDRDLRALMLGASEARWIADLFFALGILCAVLFALGRFSMGVLTRDLVKEDLDAV